MNAVLIITEVLALIILGGMTGYLALLSLLSLVARRSAPVAPGGPLRIAVVIPAHNEESSIGRTVRSVAALDYPRDLTETFVIADNCTDTTASIARSLGATVLERFDDVKKGKGHALRWTFDQLLAREPRWDGFVVIDADSTASTNFLRVMDAHLRDGAGAIQASDMVERNLHSWSSEITRLGFTLYNFSRPLGRTVIGGSAGLRGNGMCFSAPLLRKIPWNAYGVTEDLQYGLSILLEGEKVRFAADARITTTMPTIAANAESQRIRWEQGRGPVTEMFSGKLLAGAFTRFSYPLLDSWIDLVTPPFISLMALSVAVLAVHVLLWMVAPALFSAWLLSWGIVILLGIVHVIAGLASAGADARLYLVLLHVPRYALWKLLLRRKHGSSGSPEEWIRTTRETKGPGTPDAEKNHDGQPVSPHTHQ